jgi:carboxysome shell carbonic anhydrase
MTGMAVRPGRARPRFTRSFPVAPSAAVSVAVAAPAPIFAAPSSAPHPLGDAEHSAALRRRADEIDAAFDAIEPELRELAPRQFDPAFAAAARARLLADLGLDVPASALRATWIAPLDVRALHSRCVLGTFGRLVERAFARDFAECTDGERVDVLTRRFGFHAVDITPCADGRLSGVVDYILRVPPAIVTSRTSHAGAMFDVEEALRAWEGVELRRLRDASPNAGDAAVETRYLKIGVYHFSSVDPGKQGCAAHGHDGTRAARAVAGRLDQFARAVRETYGASVAVLLAGVDTDTDALRVHVPDASGALAVDRYVDASVLYDRTRGLSRDAAKDAVRDAVARCAGTSSDDAATEGMRWFCGYLLKNNLAQVDAVRARYGAAYAERGHTERFIVVGDPVDDVQLRNLAFQAQMETLEEGAADLDIGVRILHGLHAPRGFAVPVLVHERYDARIPGARERAAFRARRLRAAIAARYDALVRTGELYVDAVVRAGDGATFGRMEPVEEAE